MDIDGDDEEVVDKASREYQSQFGLPEDELLRDYFNCALQKGILHQGKMYISQHFLCFYSNILLSEAKVVIRADKLSSVDPAKILIFPTAIRVTTNDGSEYLFASFLQRDQALQMIEKIMRGEKIGKQRVKLPSELDSQASSSRSRPSAAIDKPKHLQLLEQREKKIKASKNEEANAIKSKENDRGGARSNKGTSSASSSRKNSEDDSQMAKSKPSAAAATPASAKKKGKGELVFEEEVDQVDSASDDKRRRSFDDDDDDDDDRPRKGKSKKAATKQKSSRQTNDDDDDDPMDDDDDDRRRRRRKSDSDDRRRPRREGEEEEEEDDDRTPPRRNKSKNGGSARKRRDDDSDDTRDSRDVSEDEVEREMRLEREEREARKQKKPTGKSSDLDVPTNKKKPPLHPVERSQSRSNQTATPSRSPLATPQRTPDVSDDERGQAKKKNASNTLKPPASSPSLKPAKPSSAPGSAAASDIESEAEYEMRRTRRQAAVLDDETRQVSSEFKRFSCSIFDTFTTYKLPDPRVTKINSRFKGLSQSLDTRNRRLIYEGFIKRQGKFSVVDRWCFLFTDCLIFAEIIPPEEGKSEQMYKLKQMIELSKMHIDARPVDQQKASNTAPSSSSSSSSSGAAALKEQANAAWENEAFGSGFDLIKSTKIPNPIRIISHVPENVTYVVGFTNRVERLRWLDWLQFAIARNMRAMKSPYIFAPGSSNAHAEGWWLKIIKGSVHRAAFEGDVAMLSTILKNDPSLLNSTLDLADGFTPLHYAVQGNRVEALEFLCSFPDLDLRECDSQSNSAIHLAVKLGRIECIQLLLGECAKRSIDYTIFHPVPYSTKQLTMDFALRGKNLRELSAIWACALGSHRDWAIMFRMLIKFVKDHKPQHHHHHHYMQPSYSVLNERDQQGHTLLEECVLGGLEELLPVLIQNGAAIDLPNSDGLTPLGLSASFSNEPFVRFLLQLGAQPNIRSKPNLQAPGHQCVDRATALILIRHGARYRMTSAEGKKLVDLFDEDDEKQQEQLDEAIEAAENDRPILIVKQKLNIPATNLAFQGMTSCELCCDEFSKTSSHRKKELCGKCNKVICAACSGPKLAFPLTKTIAKARPVPIQLPSLSAAGGSTAFAPIAKKDERNEIARVCDGCYNGLFYHTINVRKETARLEIERERRKKAAAERLAKHGGKVPTKNPSSTAAAKKKQVEKEKKQKKKSSKGKSKKRRDTDDDSHTDSDGSERSDDDDDDDGSDIECNSSSTTSGSDDDAELSELNDELELDEGDIYRGPEARRENPSNSAAAIASKAVISATTGLLGLVGVNIKPSKHGGDEEQGGLVETATGALNKLGSMLTSVHVSQARKTNAREISTAHGTVVISDDKSMNLPDGARFRHVRSGSLAQNGMDGPAMAMRAGAVPVDGSPLPRRSPTLTPASGGVRTLPNMKARSNNSSPAPRDHDDEPQNQKAASSSRGSMIALAFKPRRQKSLRGRRMDDDDDDAEEEEEEPGKSSRAAAAAAKNRRKSRGDTDDDDDDD